MYFTPLCYTAIITDNLNQGNLSEAEEQERDGSAEPGEVIVVIDSDDDDVVEQSVENPLLTIKRERVEEEHVPVPNLKMERLSPPLPHQVEEPVVKRERTKLLLDVVPAWVDPEEPRRLRSGRARPTL